VILFILGLFSDAKRIASNGWMMKDLLWLIPLRVYTQKPVNIHQKQQSLDIWPLSLGLIGCPETSVTNYRYSLRNNSEKRSADRNC
jgi:hypothetical protein